MPRTLIISGGSEGLGLTIARTLSASYNVYILSNDSKFNDESARQINCKFKKCDVTDYSKVETVVDEIISEAGCIDVCINNAGIWIQGELDTNSYAHIKNVIEVNTLGVIYLSKAVSVNMKQNRSGTILNVISQAGLNAKMDSSVYRASKWAVTGFTKSLRLDMQKYGVKVMAVFPGLIKTKMFEKAGVNRDFTVSLEPEEVAKAIEFMLSQSLNTMIAELGIVHSDY